MYIPYNCFAAIDAILAHRYRQEIEEMDATPITCRLCGSEFTVGTCPVRSRMDREGLTCGHCIGKHEQPNLS